MKAPKIFLTVCILVLAVCVNAYCLNVSPSKIELSILASGIYEGVLEVKNSEEKNLEVKLRTEDWFQAVQGVAKENPAGRDWLKINPLGFELKGKEVREVRYKVNVPKEAKGELNAMIFVEGRPKEAGQGAISINTSIGVPIYVIISGTERYEAKVEKVEAAGRLPSVFNVLINNSGNVHIRPTGFITVNKKGGGELFRVPLNEYHYPVLPNSSRTLEIKSGHELGEGEYVLDIKMIYGDKSFRKRELLKI